MPCGMRLGLMRNDFLSVDFEDVRLTSFRRIYFALIPSALQHFATQLPTFGLQEEYKCVTLTWMLLTSFDLRRESQAWSRLSKKPLLVFLQCSFRLPVC